MLNRRPRFWAEMKAGVRALILIAIVSPQADAIIGSSIHL